MILQKQIPYDTTYPNLPGTRPISPDEWIICDDAFSQQMALRDKLIETKKDKVLAKIQVNKSKPKKQNRFQRKMAEIMEQAEKQKAMQQKRKK